MAGGIFMVTCLTLAMAAVTAAQDPKTMPSTTEADQSWEKAMLRELRALNDVLANQANRSGKETVLEELLHLKAILTTQAVQPRRRTILEEMLDLKAGSGGLLQRSTHGGCDGFGPDLLRLMRQVNKMTLKIKDLEDANLALRRVQRDLEIGAEALRNTDVVLRNASEALENDVKALRNTDAASKDADDEIRTGKGTSYVRWGHAGCPKSSELVYTGIVGGPYHSNKGGAGNYLCLTSDPVFDDHEQPTGHGFARIFGSEYETCYETKCQTTPVCAACRVPRATSVMIPGTNRCSPGWTLEYSGYIMAGYDGNSASSEYICVDSSQENYGGSSGSRDNNNQNVLFYTHVKCGALPCPPYVDDKFALCVVCSK